VKDRPLVSIVIPVYNHEKFVEQALDSVLAEKYPHKELCIVDDGSTDRSPEIVEEWITKHEKAFTRPILFERRKNSGIPKTLNYAISKCHGHYVVPLASDDKLLSGGIEARINFLLQHPKLRAVCSDCEVINADGELLYESGIEELHNGNKKRLSDPRWLLTELLLNWAMPGPVILYEKDAWKDIGGYNEDLVVEDWDFYLRLAERGWLGFLDCKVAQYRLHDRNVCRLGTMSLQLSEDLLYTAKMATKRMPWPEKLAAISIAISRASGLARARRGHFAIAYRIISKLIRQVVKCFFAIYLSIIRTKSYTARRERILG